MIWNHKPQLLELALNCYRMLKAVGLKQQLSGSLVILISGMGPRMGIVDYHGMLKARGNRKFLYLGHKW